MGRLRYSIAYQGVPDAIRGRVWAKILDIENIKNEVGDSSIYQKLLEHKGKSKVRKDI